MDEIKVATIRPMSKSSASSLHGQFKFYMVLLFTIAQEYQADVRKKLTLFFRNSWFVDKPSHFNPVGMYWQKYEKKNNKKNKKQLLTWKCTQKGTSAYRDNITSTIKKKKKTKQTKRTSAFNGNMCPSIWYNILTQSPEQSKFVRMIYVHSC